MEYVGLNVEEEKSKENSAEIWNVALGKIQIEINGRVSSKNPPKVKRTSQQDQQQVL